MSASPISLSGSSVFLTGGTGLVGSHIARALRHQAVSVRALCRETSEAVPLERIGCELVRGNVEEGAEALAPLMEGASAVVHAAGVTYTSVPWARMQSVNVEGTKNVLEAAVSLGIRRAVHISSVVVYGEQEGPVDETSSLEAPLRRRDRYARTKREAERAGQSLAEKHDMALTALRPSAVYGEGDRVLTPKLAKTLELPLHPLLGGGETPLPLVYAGNLAQAAIAALAQPDPPAFRAYNVADDHPTTLRWLLSALATHLGSPFRPVSIPAPMVHGLAGLGDALGLRVPGAEGMPLGRAARLAVRDNPYRSSRIREELGWRPVFPLEEAVSRTARWMEHRKRSGGEKTSRAGGSGASSRRGKKEVGRRERSGEIDR